MRLVSVSNVSKMFTDNSVTVVSDTFVKVFVIIVKRKQCVVNTRKSMMSGLECITIKTDNNTSH